MLCLGWVDGGAGMTENEVLEYLKSSKRKSNMLGILPGSDIGNSIIKALEEVQQYRAIGALDECQTAMEKQTETLTVDKAKTIAAKAICIGCGYLADCKCDYNGGNCMVSKPMLESVSKSFDYWNRRANNETD